MKQSCFFFVFKERSGISGIHKIITDEVRAIFLESLLLMPALDLNIIGALFD